MACWQPRDDFVSAVDLLHEWVAAASPGLTNGWLDDDALSTLSGAVGQGSSALMKGYEYADCLDRDGRSPEAESLRTYLDQLQRELAELFELCR